MNYPNMTIWVKDENLELVICKHTIDPDLDRIVGKDETEQFLRIAKSDLPSILHLYMLDSMDQLIGMLNNDLTFYALMETLKSNHITYEYHLI
jgi:hypothetical protein